MAFMEWNSGLSVQVATFDEQHKKLLAMVNRLHEAMLQRTGREALAAIFSDLIAYTGTHFADEEAAMKKHQYPGYLAHALEHQKLTRKAQELNEKYKNNELAVTLEVMEFLKTWLATHIKGTDKKYGEYFAARGITV